MGWVVNLLNDESQILLLLPHKNIGLFSPLFSCFLFIYPAGIKIKSNLSGVKGSGRIFRGTVQIVALF